MAITATTTLRQSQCAFRLGNNPTISGPMLILSLFDATGKTFIKNWQFDQSSHIQIGRDPENQVVIDDPLVSRFHADLQANNQWQLISHGTNGTFVNGQKVEQAILVSGNMLQLGAGGPLLRFETVGAIHCQHQGNTPDRLFCVHCGQPILVVKTIRDYQILKPLGQGGMGSTYLAWNQQRMLVLKEMNAEVANNTKAQELFEREAKILSTLQHSGIPRYQDFFAEAGKRYLAMDLVHGQDLERYVISKGPVTLQQAIEWVLQLCEILTYIHSQRPPLIHRDVKPANLLVSNVGQRIFLIDFGAVKESGSVGSTRIGAPDYMAPEQNQGKPVTQSDIYALGPTILFLVTGENPSKYLTLTTKGYEFSVSNVPTITPQLADVIHKMSADRASERYATAAAAAIALQNCL
jgi:serine/threonine protein kinase, bacterial